MSPDHYVECLEEDVFSNPGLTDHEGAPADSRPYFYGHRPRFDAQIEMFRKHLDGQIIRRVYDLGTGLPFASYYFYVTQGAEVLYGMPPEGEHEINEQVRYVSLNLCNRRPQWKPAELVICTECLEHLPCPIPPVLDYLKGLVKPRGHLLLSFPFGTLCLGDLDHDFGDHDEISNKHLREFTKAKADEALALIGWPIVDEALTFTKAYDGNIWNVLLRNRATP